MTIHSPEQVDVRARLRECGLFEACDEREIAAIVRASRTRAVARGRSLYEQGATAADVFLLLDGGIKLTREAGQGRRKVLRLIYPVDLFGLLDVLVDGRRNFTAIAFAPSELLVIDGNVLLRVLNANARFAVAVLRRSAARFRRLASWWGRVNQAGAREKVAVYLVEEAGCRASDAGNRACPTHRDIASLLGITPETLSRELAWFRERGWVRFERNGLLNINDADSLRSLVEV